MGRWLFVFFFKQKTAYEVLRSLVGSTRSKFVDNGFEDNTRFCTVTVATTSSLIGFHDAADPMHCQCEGNREWFVGRDDGV